MGDSKFESRKDKYKIGEISGFSIYSMNDLEGGELFAEASMGFLGEVGVDVDKKKDSIEVTCKTTQPIFATLGMQLAGWKSGGFMLSGPARFLAKKPGFIFDRINFDESVMPAIACLEGEGDIDEVVKDLESNGIFGGRILIIEENSPAQAVNVCSRAIEVVMYRMMDMGLFDRNGVKAFVDSAESTVKCDLKEFEDGLDSNSLNDCLRFNGNVTLKGRIEHTSLKKIREIETKNTIFKNKKFGDILKESGGDLYKVNLSAFSVGSLEFNEVSGE